MFDSNGLVCLVFILFFIARKSLLKGGAHSRGSLFKNIYFREGVHSRGVLFQGESLFRGIRYFNTYTYFSPQLINMAQLDMTLKSTKEVLDQY